MMNLFIGGAMGVFITGGTSGMGLELCKRFLADGHHVGICSRSADSFDKSVFSPGSKVYVYKADVTDKPSLEIAINDFVSKAGELSIVIASAGRSVGAKTKIPSFDIAREIVAINILGFLNTFDIALKIMLKQKKGHLVALSSVAGLVGPPGVAAYSGSKGFVLNFCESLMLDLKDQNIDVTVICPGFVDTPLTKKNNHKMPFLMNSIDASKIMYDAIKKKQKILIFPWQMKIVMIFLRIIPRSIYRMLMGVKLINYSKN